MAASSSEVKKDLKKKASKKSTADCKDLFLFDGGEYKRGEDDGRVRVPLDCIEAQKVHLDPELGTTNANVGTLMMSKYPELDNLSAGDRVYIQVLPDAMLYKGIWVMPGDAYQGMKFALDLVDVCEVSLAYEAGDDLGSVPTYLGEALIADADVGLGDATDDACTKPQIYGGTFTDYRDVSAFQSLLFKAPNIAPVGHALYLRMTILEMPEEQPETDCSHCGSDYGLPEIQHGVIFDNLGVDPHRIGLFCRCRERICAGDCGK